MDEAEEGVFGTLDITWEAFPVRSAEVQIGPCCGSCPRGKFSETRLQVRLAVE